jgi:hypothetical protein
MHPSGVRITDNGWFMCTFSPIPEPGFDHPETGVKSTNISRMPKIISRIVDEHNHNRVDKEKIKKNQYMDQDFLPHISLGFVDVNYLNEARKILEEQESEVLKILNQELPYLVIKTISIEKKSGRKNLRKIFSYSLPKRNFGISNIQVDGYCRVLTFSSIENKNRFHVFYSALSRNIRETIDKKSLIVNENEFNGVVRNFDLKVPDQADSSNPHFFIRLPRWWINTDIFSKDKNLSQKAVDLLIRIPTIPLVLLSLIFLSFEATFRVFNPPTPSPEIPKQFSLESTSSDFDEKRSDQARYLVKPGTTITIQADQGKECEDDFLMKKQTAYEECKCLRPRMLSNGVMA